jgi:hypothetical protein
VKKFLHGHLDGIDARIFTALQVPRV